MAANSQAAWGNPQLEGKTFVLIGKAFRAIQDTARFITDEGASIVDGLGKEVDYVVVPVRGQEDEVAAIRKSAKQLNRQGANIELITPGEIVGVLKLSADDVIAMLQAGKPGVTRFKNLVKPT